MTSPNTQWFGGNYIDYGVPNQYKNDGLSKFPLDPRYKVDLNVSIWP